MTTWSELMRSQLDLPYWTPGEDAVPFGVPPERGLAQGLGTGAAWEVHGLTQRNGDWVLSAHAGRGLEATYFLRFFSDTRSAECWGEITNRGNDAVTGIRESLTLDTPFRLTEEFDRPWVRSVNGVSFHPTAFPPEDFAVADRQILGPHMYESILRLSGGEEGRSSERLLPCAILGNESGTAGLAFMLEWSGMWSIRFHHRTWGDPFVARPELRIQIGMRGLDLDLRPGQTLPLPRLLITAYDGDLEAGGNAIRRHIRRHVTPALGAEPVLPPTSYNSWFAFEYDISADFLKPAVDAAGAAGLEYFVVDSGWFRGADRGSKTDQSWDAHPIKFPDGIGPFADYVRSQGMKYGTWFEPESAARNHELWRHHRDWFWETDTGTQLGNRKSADTAIINFGLAEARDWWIERITRAYEEWGVRWIRWDFNFDPRSHWESKVPSGELGWRQIAHIQGLYATLDEIMRACPDLFIEQCASGGYRIDLGTVRRGHSFWMNDVTEQSDLVRAFQHGLNTVLPGNYANTNLYQARHDFTEYDFLSHAAGGFGTSGHLWEAPRAQFDDFTHAVARYKKYRHLLLGDYSRPTGQPLSKDDYAKVVFSDAAESMVMEFNHDGAGTARLHAHDG